MLIVPQQKNVVFDVSCWGDFFCCLPLRMGVCTNVLPPLQKNVLIDLSHMNEISSNYTTRHLHKEEVVYTRACHFIDSFALLHSGDERSLLSKVYVARQGP